MNDYTIKVDSKGLSDILFFAASAKARNHVIMYGTAWRV